MPTLADLIDLIMAANLTPTQTRDQVSAVRRITRLLESDPIQIQADPAGLRRRLDALSPETLGLSRASWSNLRSLLGRALEHARVVAPSRRVNAISAAWQTLLARMDQNRRTRLSALARTWSAQGVEPPDVTLEHLVSYQNMIINDRLRGNAEITWDHLTWAWNRCVGEVEGWPQVMIPREDRRERYILAWSAFPASLKADVDAFLLRQSGKDLSEDGPPRPLRPSSLKTRERQLRIVASALVHGGITAAG